MALVLRGVWGVGVGDGGVVMDETDNELDTLRQYCHAHCCHPWYEYATTDGPRKAFDEHMPAGLGWERNVEEGTNGWERFDYHEEAYWRRLIPQPSNDRP